MMERITGALIGLSPRERGLLAALFGLALPLALVFFWILPMGQAWDAAHQDLSAARNLQTWVAVRTAENTALRQLLPQNGGAARAIGLSGIEESLKAAGLRSAVTRLSNREGAAVELGFETVNFTDLTGWLTRVEPEWGYHLAAFRVEASETPGLVAAEFLLEPKE